MSQILSRKWAAIFPGQGSQHPGMGKELFENFKVAKTVYEEASDSIGLDLKKLCFEGPESDLKLTANTQPALLVTSIAAWRVFTSECDLRPSVVMGHSLGEYSALVAAESLSLSEAMVTVRIRGQAMQDAVPVGTGGMSALMGLHDDQVISACHDMQALAQTQGGLKNCVLEAANFNSPGQVVISGHTKALEYMKEHLVPENYGATRVKQIPLAVSAPFHSSLMKPAAMSLKAQLEKVNWARELKIDVVHNVNAEINRDGMKVKDFLFDQMTKPVLWTTSVIHAIRHLETKEGSKFAEFGAGRILSGLVKKTDPKITTFNVDTLINLKDAMGALQ